MHVVLSDAIRRSIRVSKALAINPIQVQAGARLRDELQLNVRLGRGISKNGTARY